MNAFIANPVRVTAAQIVAVADSPNEETGRWDIALDNGTTYEAAPELFARYSPAPGDYLVVQEDGYTCLNPREVFERKYSPEGARVTFAADREIALFLRDVAERVLSGGEEVEHAVVVYGAYGGTFRVHSTESGVGALGMLSLGERIMQDAIVRPLAQENGNG